MNVPPSNFLKKDGNQQIPSTSKQMIENTKIVSKEMIIKDFPAKYIADNIKQTEPMIMEKQKYKFSMDEIQKKTQDRLLEFNFIFHFIILIKKAMMDSPKNKKIFSIV